MNSKIVASGFHFGCWRLIFRSELLCLLLISIIATSTMQYSAGPFFGPPKNSDFLDILDFPGELPVVP